MRNKVIKKKRAMLYFPDDVYTALLEYVVRNKSDGIRTNMSKVVTNALRAYLHVRE